MSLDRPSLAGSCGALTTAHGGDSSRSCRLSHHDPASKSSTYSRRQRSSRPSREEWQGARDALAKLEAEQAKRNDEISSTSARPTITGTAPGRDCSVKQRYNSRPHRDRRAAAIPVHSRRDSGAVVQQGHLSTKLLGVVYAGLPAEISEEGLEPGAILLGNDFTRIVGSRLGAGHDEPASTKLRPCQRPLELGEHAEQAISWSVVCGENVGDASLPVLEMLVEVRPDELLFAAEGAVERGLGDAGPFDDPVYTDNMHAFRIKELVGGGQQAISRR